METTLEVRWFVRGMPPAVVQRWYRLECPGKLLAEEPEIREDLYGYQKHDLQQGLNSLRQLEAFPSHLVNCEEVNLKLREGNLELKLRQQELGTQQFGKVNHGVIWEGKVEQWCKFGEDELKHSGLFTAGSLPKTDWICVDKKRQQKIDRGVTSELTWLRINNEPWWSVAFEMTQNHQNLAVNWFQKMVEQAAINYYGPKLSSNNSYSYSRWQNQAVS